MARTLRHRIMSPRRWLGAVFIFVFLPVNVPLLAALAEKVGSTPLSPSLVIGLWILGFVIFLFPDKEEMKRRLMMPEEE